MALNINGISQKWNLTTTLLTLWSTTNTLLIEPTPTIRHKKVIDISFLSGKNSTLKSHDHESESYNKFKNFSLKIPQLSPWHITSGHFSCKVYHFSKAPVFWVSYLFISVRVFVMCYFCNYYFQIALKGAILLGVSDACQTVIFYGFTNSLKKI